MSYGYEVEAFDTANQALSALQNNLDCNVFICDMRMPTMDGLEVLKRAKQCKTSLKFILMSAQLSKEELHLAQQYKVDGILDKPFGMHELNELLTSFTM